MGNAKIRRLCHSEAKWTDKTAVRHRHSYTVHAVARIEYTDTVAYFDVMRCNLCNSFKGIPRPGSVCGILGTDLNLNMDLPVIRLKSSRGMRIGFNDLTLSP